MSDLEKTCGAANICPAGYSPTEFSTGNYGAAQLIQHPTRQLLSDLAFKTAGLRIGIELSACVALHLLLKQTLPWPFLSYSLEGQILLSWFIACITVAIVDYNLFALPISRYRRACQAELAGDYQTALEQLEQIAPTTNCLVPCPAPLYHLRRASILAHSGHHATALKELSTGHAAGLNTLDYYLLRSELLRQNGEFAQARNELQLGRYVLGDHPCLRLEEAIISFEERKDLRTARREFERVLSLPTAPYLYGETSTTVASAYREVTRLWTGEAEEGLEGLSTAIDNIRAAASFIESLRPMLANLLLERSHYLVTHREPVAGICDLQQALHLCQYPNVIKRSSEIEEEHRWRTRG